MLKSALLALFLAATQPNPQPAMKFVQRSGQTLHVGGAQLILVGFNRYELAGGPQAKVCQHWGGDNVWWAWAKARIDDTANVGGNVMRLWAFQNYAGPSGSDFRYLDKVVAYARQRRIRLIPVLTNQWDACDQGGTKDAKWLTEGYKHPYGSYKLSFNQYLDLIVNRYKNEPAIAMWQVINEGKLYEQPKILAQFIATAARRIKSIDKNHLVSSGGALQCWQGRQGAEDFRSYNADAAIDVADTHQYDEDDKDWPVCMEDSLRAAQSLNKPLIIGEAGIKSSSPTDSRQAEQMRAKMRAAAQRKVAGFLIWSIGEKTGGFDGFDITKSSLTAKELGQARKSWPR